MDESLTSIGIHSQTGSNNNVSCCSSAFRYPFFICEFQKSNLMDCHFGLIKFFKLTSKSQIYSLIKILTLKRYWMWWSTLVSLFKSKFDRLAICKRLTYWTFVAVKSKKFNKVNIFVLWDSSSYEISIFVLFMHFV